MILRRPAADRGHADHGWLKTAHSFSFGDYYDPDNMGFRSLRVINEDHIAAGAGFGTHPHRDMEILTWVLSGGLAHKDSMGHGATLGPNEVQVMSAGTGITHSEFNASETEPIHLLQIWIQPERTGLTPRYDQKHVDPTDMRDRLLLLAAPPEAGGVVDIFQDVHLWAAELTDGARVEHIMAPGRAAWVQVTRGAVALNGTELNAGDAGVATEEAMLALVASANSQFLLFDLV